MHNFVPGGQGRTPHVGAWLSTYDFDPRERQPVHGYEQTREAAMAAFAKSWRRE